MDYRKKSLECHEMWRGKIEIKPRVGVESKDDLSLAYTPGVAEACLAIKEDVEKSFVLTRRWNVVPVITDGTAVLGLGDIGPEAGLPVMEGKAALFKTFGDIDAYPLCIRTKDPEEIIKTIKLFAGSWGGINLEDIGAPRCFEIERRLKEELDIPVFHDDQHGTAIVTAAALINALKLVNKKMEDIHIVVNGPGAAGISITKFLINFGAKHILICDRQGILYEDKPGLDESKIEIAKLTNKENVQGTLKDAMKGADVFIGVSGPNCVTKEMVASMNEKAIVFALANPIPEINPMDAKEGGAYIVGTGSSEYNNQINNVLVFPGLFRGAIDARATTINFEMMQAASYGIANVIPDEELNPNYILPLAYDRRAHESVARLVKEAAFKTGVIKQ